MPKKLRTCLRRVIRDITRKIEGDSGVRSGVRTTAHAGTARARAAAAPARAQGLFPARAGSRMHRQGPSALRVRRQGLRRDHHQPRQGGQFVTHVKAMPGNPYDGHTLASVIPEIEALVGNTVSRIFAGKGYRGHNAPPDYKFRVFISGQKRDVTPRIKRQLRRRSANEPVIGPSQSRAPHGPQLSLVLSGRCRQRRPRRRRP
jgi:IS5 family transposase